MGGSLLGINVPTSALVAGWLLLGEGTYWERTAPLLCLTSTPNSELQLVSTLLLTSVLCLSYLFHHSVTPCSLSLKSVRFGPASAFKPIGFLFRSISAANTLAGC